MSGNTRTARGKRYHQIIECLKYNEKRVAVVITVKTVAPGQINATVVSTQNLSISIVGKSSYDPDYSNLT
jgi:hypothetical protein